MPFDNAIWNLVVLFRDTNRGIISVIGVHPQELAQINGLKISPLSRTTDCSKKRPGSRLRALLYPKVHFHEVIDFGIPRFTISKIIF